MMKTLVRAALMCTLIASLSACQKTKVVNDFTGPSPTSTGSGGTGTGIVVTPVSESFVAPCQKTVVFAATGLGSGGVNWRIEPSSSASIGAAGTPVTAIMRASGTYTVTATSTQDPRVSGSFSITLDCGGTSAGAPGSFRQDGAVICSPLDTSRAERTIGFSWTSAGGGATYRVEEKSIGGGSASSWQEVQNNSNLSISLTRRRWSFQYFYRVTATLNGSPRLWDNGEWQAPCEQLADPAPPPPAPPTTGPGPGGTGPSGPGPGGPITCSWSGATSVSQGGSISATASCTGGALPAWYSTDPSRVQVQGTSPTTVGGKSFQTGHSATLRGIFRGSANVCVQPAISEDSPASCRMVTVN